MRPQKLLLILLAFILLGVGWTYVVYINVQAVIGRSFFLQAIGVMGFLVNLTLSVHVYHSLKNK